VGEGMSRQLSRTKSERGEEAGGAEGKAMAKEEKERGKLVCVREKVCERAREKESERARTGVFVWERTRESKRARE